MRCARTFPALLTVLTGVAGCGDGVDERYDSRGNQINVREESKEQEDRGKSDDSTGAQGRDDLPTPVLEHFDTAITGSRADYSGASSMIRVGDEWLVSGFDNDSNPQQPERGAIWRSDDLEHWLRTGFDISEGDDQQGIAQLLEVDGTVLAFGVDFSGTGVDTLGDAVVWRSNDTAESFEEVKLGGHGAVAQALVVDGVIWAVGVKASDGFITGQIWRSDDVGETWEELDPVIPDDGSDDPLGPLNGMVVSGDDLIVFGNTTVTDPERDGERISEDEWSGFLNDVKPVDIGLWASHDQGSNWEAAATSGFAGERGFQNASAALVVGDRLVVAGYESSRTDSLRYQPLLWTCDIDLEECDRHVPYKADFDFTSATLASVNGLVVFAIRGADFEDFDQSGRVGFYDPVSNRSRTTPLEGKIEQIEWIYIDEEANSIYFLGRDPATNLMHVASAPIPA